MHKKDRRPGRRKKTTVKIRDRQKKGATIYGMEGTRNRNMAIKGKRYGDSGKGHYLLGGGELSFRWREWGVEKK